MYGIWHREREMTYIYTEREHILYIYGEIYYKQLARAIMEAEIP